MGDQPMNFDPTTGEVRLIGQSGHQLICRVTEHGLLLWNRHRKRECLVPWHELDHWRACQPGQRT